MDPKIRKSVSWTLSVLIHGVLAVFIIRAGLHYALPEGEVTSTTIDVTGGGDNNPPPSAPSVPAPPAPNEPSAPHDALAKEIKTQAQPKVKAEPLPPTVEAKTETPPTTTDDAPAPEEPQHSEPVADVPPPPPQKSSDDNDADTAAAASAAGDKAVDSEKEGDTEKPGQQDSVVIGAVSNAPPPAEPAEEAPAPAATPGDGKANQDSNGNDAAAKANASAAAAAATAGTGASGGGKMIDETKLVEKFGNRRPSYPWTARLRRQEGTVILHATVDKDGFVSNVTVQQSSGFPTLDDECVRTYSHWRYEPGASGQVIKPFKFNLSSK